MASFELKMLTDLSALPKVVETNISEVEPLILAAIKKTDGLLVGGTKAEVDAADADAACLGKLRDAVKRFRIDNVALWKRPMDDFEAKCKELEKRLDEVHITANKNTVPNETLSPFITSGLRIGTPAVTSRTFIKDQFSRMR